MKICIIGNSSSIHIKKWAEMLSIDNDVTVITIKSHYDPSGKYKVISLPYGNSVGYFSNAHILKRLVDSEKFDIINAHYASGYGILTTLSGINPVLTVWGSDITEFPRRSKLHLVIMKNILRKAKFVTASSEFLMSKTIEIESSVIGKCLVVPFGVDTATFAPGPKPLSERKSIGFVKSVEDIYGVRNLVSAFSNYVNVGAGDLNLIIVGKGSQSKSISRMINDLGISHRVKMLGYIDNKSLPDLYSTFKVFVMPTIVEESYGVSAIEAMSCGVPCIVSNRGGPPFIVGDTGRIINPDSIEEITQSIIDLEFELNQGNLYSDRARSRVLSEYSNDIALEKMIEAYKRGG